MGEKLIRLSALASARWAIVAAIVLLGIAGALQMNWQDWVESWVGTMFKAVSGGAIGWVVSRYVIRLDLSNIPPEQRPLAGLSMAVLIAGFANAVATGA